IGELKPAGAPGALVRAYVAGQRDAHYAARAAALGALAKFGAAEAVPTLRTALADPDWAVRVRAVMLLKQLDPSAAADDDARRRPAPTTLGADAYAADRLVKSIVPPQVFVDTDRGTIQLELATLDAQ